MIKIRTLPPKITGREFENCINIDPSCCKDLKEPLEITTYVDLADSKITHLSPLVNFSGRDMFKNTASFRNCKNLKVATGTFSGSVDFSNSGIEKIENLITDTKATASFSNCPIKYIPKKYRDKVFFFDKKTRENSILVDEIHKIKSETNNIVI